MKIGLSPLGPDDFGQVAHIRVTPEQEAWAGTVAEAFAQDPARFDLHVIEADGAAVGLFRIDRDYRRTIPIAGKGTLGLRGFMIDHRRQGEGIGSAALKDLPEYLRRHYPDARSVDLTVNHRNRAAMALYRTGGFADTGRDWLEGRAGPQDLLRLPLRPLPAGAGWRMRLRRALVRVRRFVPPGLRLVLGLMLIAAGALGFLPVLGFWMIPLGMAVAALDIRPLWRALKARMSRTGRRR